MKIFYVFISLFFFSCSKSCIECDCYKKTEKVHNEEFCDYFEQDPFAAERGLMSGGEYDECNCYYK